MILIDTALDGRWDMFWNAFSHIILPAGLLGYVSMAYISRMTRSLHDERTGAGIHHDRPGQGHARTAGDLGPCDAQRAGAADHGDRAVLCLSCWKASVLTETIFAWPGLGSYITDALLVERHARRAGRNHRGGRGLHRAEHAVGPPLPPGRPEGALMAAADGLAARPQPAVAPAGEAGADLSRLAAAPAQSAGDGGAGDRRGAAADGGLCAADRPA